MAEKTPLYMDINSVYSGDELGLPNRDVMGEGVVGAGDMLISAGAGNTINVAAGAGWVTGDTDVVNQPTYRIINDAVVNKGITPDPTNPRYVRVFGQITDATFSGAARNWVITTLHGTPAGSPTIPALPASAIDLATVLVPAAAASSAAYTFTDNRARARVGGGQVLGPPDLVYTEVNTSAVTNVVSTNIAAPSVIVTAPSLTFDGLTSVWIEAYIGDVQPDIAAAGRRITVGIYDNGVVSRVFGFFYGQVAGVTLIGTPYGKFKLTPSAGAHVYTIGSYVSAGTGIIGTGPGGGADVPAWLRVTKA